MINYIDNIYIWIPVALFVYIGFSIFSVKIENDYQIKFEREKTTWKAAIPSIVCFLIALVTLFAKAKNLQVAASYVPFAMAFAALRTVWVIDRMVLLIPDRAQVIGATAGMLYVGIQCLSGENKSELFLSLAAGLGMVFLLWLLSVIYFRMRGSIGFGFGDIKLLAWLSLFVGSRMSDLILISIGLGIVNIIISTVFKSVDDKKVKLPALQDSFAFGPSIVLGYLILEFIRYA